MRAAVAVLLGLTSCTTRRGSEHRPWTIADVEFAVVAVPLSIVRQLGDDDSWDTIRRCEDAQTIMRRSQPCAAEQQAEMRFQAVVRLPTDVDVTTGMGGLNGVELVWSSISTLASVRWTVIPRSKGRAVFEWTVEVTELLRPLGLFTTLVGVRWPPVTIAMPDAAVARESGREVVATGRWYVREVPIRRFGKTVEPSPFVFMFLVKPRDESRRALSPVDPTAPDSSTPSRTADTR